MGKRRKVEPNDHGCNLKRNSSFFSLISGEYIYLYSIILDIYIYIYSLKNTHLLLSPFHRKERWPEVHLLLKVAPTMEVVSPPSSSSPALLPPWVVSSSVTTSEFQEG